MHAIRQVGFFEVSIFGVNCDFVIPDCALKRAPFSRLLLKEPFTARFEIPFRKESG